MDLNYIESQLAEINRTRRQILNEMNLTEHESEGDNFSKKFKRAFSKLENLKMACIMDPFTYQSFEPECELFQITPQHWYEELENFKPDLFFLESAWRGKDDLWNTKVDYLSDELIEVLSYCKKNDIPIVFWNKEDPVHFNTFIETAKHADFVFTTDIDCVKNYKTILGHDHVYLMPFAAQTKYHNPVEKYKRKDKFCFAGAYYKRYPERIKDLKTFVEAITDSNEIDIYDRNYYHKDPNYSFPKEYKRYIVGNLKPDEIDKAYKGYKFNINMNSVKQSQSMCARRVFELLASNTITVSNFSRAMRNLFGDLVICTDDGKRLKEELQKFNDFEYYSKFRLLGLRKVLSQHTYHERLLFMVNQIYEEPVKYELPKVAVMANAQNEGEVEYIIRQFNRQVYLHKKLIIVTDVTKDFSSNSIIQISTMTDEKMKDIQKNYPYLAFFSSNDYYGKNYIYDFVLTLKYDSHPLISKSTYFNCIDDSFNRNEENPPYNYIECSMLRKSMVRSNFFDCVILKKYVESIDTGIINAPGFSIDEYNYCMNYQKDECPAVDDLILTDLGLNMDHIHSVVKQIQPSNIEHNGTPKDIEFSNGCFLNKSNVLLVTDNYPDYNDLYRYAFVHTRLNGYKKEGLSVDLFKFNERYPKGYSEFYGIDVTCGFYEDINKVLMEGSYDTILIHFFTEEIWNSIKNSLKGKRIIVWIHGAEIQPWWRREYNYTNQQQLEIAKKQSDKRYAFWKEIFDLALDNKGYKFHFVFVSKYFAGEVFEDFKISLPEENYSIIHNYVNNELFIYNKKDVESRKKILSVRPFSNQKYANDLMVKCILELSKDPIFKDLEFRIVGKGELFKSTVKPIRKYKNVILEERFLRQHEIAELHKEYGVFLNPTRWDSQGVSRDEAMSSGLVPITNVVSAIPEFVDESCCMLVSEEDYMGMADCIRKLYYDPELFLRLSENAAVRVRNQSGIDKTIVKEVELITNK